MRFRDRLSLPLIAAPMFLISGVELVVAACRNGVIGSFPTVNCRNPEQLDAWLGEIADRLRLADENKNRPDHMATGAQHDKGHLYGEFQPCCFFSTTWSCRRVCQKKPAFGTQWVIGQKRV